MWRRAVIFSFTSASVYSWTAHILPIKAVMYQSASPDCTHNYWTNRYQPDIRLKLVVGLVDISHADADAVSGAG